MREGETSAGLNSQEVVESLGVEAAQNLFFAGRNVFNIMSRLVHSEQKGNLENATKSVERAISSFYSVIERVRQNLPSPDTVREATEEIDWEKARNFGQKKGFIHELNFNIWECIVAGVQRDDPLVAPKIVVSNLIAIRNRLQTIRTQSEGSRVITCMKCIHLLCESVLVGCQSSYVNMIVGQQVGAKTVPSA